MKKNKSATQENIFKNIDPINMIEYLIYLYERQENIKINYEIKTKS